MDEIDKIQTQWAAQRPDIDTEPMALIGRLIRVSRHITQKMEATFAEFGLNGAGFDVLATLLRAGAPHALSPNQLLETMMITSGTMTNRIDRLEAQGLVARVQAAEDKRSVLISLTAKGKELIDAAVTAHVETQTRLMGPMSAEEREALNATLKSYLARVSAHS